MSREVEHAAMRFFRVVEERDEPVRARARNHGSV